MGRGDRLLSALGIGLVLDTILGLVLAGLNLRSPHEFQGYQAWNRVLWVVLLAAVLLRALRRVTLLTHTVSHQEMQLHDVARTSHEWLWETTEDFVVTSCSPAVTFILGRLVDEVIGHDLFEFVADDSGPAAEALMDATNAISGWTEVTLQWWHAGGHQVRLQGSGVPILDVRGQIVGFRGTWGLAHDTDTERRMATIRSRTRETLDNQSLTLAIQPIVRLDSATCTGVESLARFPDRRSPAIWIAEAHQVGLGLELEAACLDLSLAYLQDLPAGLYMAVNASPQLILSPHFGRILNRHEAHLERVVVEITEHIAIYRYTDIHLALSRYRERGLRLVVDDTGAGFASFSHVLSLRPDIIKLDRSLITGIHTDPARRAFVKAVVSLALELDATVTAEGVESTDELAVLQELWVHSAQGYLFAPPAPGGPGWDGWAGQDWTQLAANRDSVATTGSAT